MSEELIVEANQLAAQLVENYNRIKNIVFCSNCTFCSDCYMYSVFSLIGLKTGYCAAGIAREEKEDNECLTLITKLSNPDLVTQDLFSAGKHKLREQKRMLKHYTYCEDCENHKCCDAEDVMIDKKIIKPYCGVGIVKVRE